MNKPAHSDGVRACEVCGTEVSFDAEWCPICGAEMAEEEMKEDIRWEIVRTVSTIIEAELMAGRLRSHGIPTVVLSQVDSTRNFTVGDLAIVKVFVPSIYLDEARGILSTDADEGDEAEEE